MRYRVFGRRTGLKVSEFVLGSGLLGKLGGYGAEPDEVQRILRGYAEAGGNFIDTADNYLNGESERTIGAFIAPNRNDFVVASKYGRGAAQDPALATLGANRKSMVQSVEESLRRLKTDRIDLYFAHLDDRITPVEEIVRGFDDLIRAGKIVHGGFSNFPAWRVSAAVTRADLRGWSPVAALEVEFSLLQRTTERELLPMADAFGLGVMGYSPLGGGLLTGKYRRGEAGRATELPLPARQDEGITEPAIDALTAIADELGANPGQVALAWVLAKGVFPIVGPRTRAQLDDNLAAADLKLGEEQIRRLDEATAVPRGYPHDLLDSPMARAAVAGDRWDSIDFPNQTVA